MLLAYDVGVNEKGLTDLRKGEAMETLGTTYGCHVRKAGVTEGWVRFGGFATEADLDKAIAFFEWLGFEVS